MSTMSFGVFSPKQRCYSFTYSFTWRDTRKLFLLHITLKKEIFSKILHPLMGHALNAEVCNILKKTWYWAGGSAPVYHGQFRIYSHVIILIEDFNTSLVFNTLIVPWVQNIRYLKLMSWTLLWQLFQGLKLLSSFFANIVV